MDRTGPRPRVHIITDAQGAYVWLTWPGGRTERVDLTAEDAAGLISQAADAWGYLHRLERRINHHDHHHGDEDAPPDNTHLIEG